MFASITYYLTVNILPLAVANLVEVQQNYPDFKMPIVKFAC